ncbi:hypothetical protein SK128_013547 [Halocaridina rubra]|uniref:Tudor domain-containing protein n=1 Tax=Halocaridina rubra TaxID=373956 RepID=A0AAN8WU95_HALRR
MDMIVQNSHSNPIPILLVLPVKEFTILQVIEGDMSQELNVFPAVNLPHLSLPVNSSEKFLVKITAMLDPSHVYISPVFNESLFVDQDILKAEAEEYKKFFVYINSNYEDYEQVYDPHIGCIYIGMISTETWYRVQVLDKSSKFVTALFVDTGSSGDLPVEQ